jgi:hypothetical protein
VQDHPTLRWKLKPEPRRRRLLLGGFSPSPTYPRHLNQSSQNIPFGWEENMFETPALAIEKCTSPHLSCPCRCPDSLGPTEDASGCGGMQKTVVSTHCRKSLRLNAFSTCAGVSCQSCKKMLSEFLAVTVPRTAASSRMLLLTKSRTCRARTVPRSEGSSFTFIVCKLVWLRSWFWFPCPSGGNEMT